MTSLKEDPMNLHECKVCSKKIGERRFVSCALCFDYYHLRCLKFGDKEHEVLQQREGICYLCEDCRYNAKPEVRVIELKKQNDLMLTSIRKIEKAVEEQKVPISKIDHELSCVHSLVKEAKSDSDKGTAANGDNQSFASVLKSVCVIKPKNEQEREITKKAIKERINPANVNVSGLRNAGAAGIAIVCDNLQSLNEVKNIAEQKMSEQYDIEIPKPILPRVKVSGLDENLDKDSIKQKILAQNDLPVGPSEEINILAVRDTKKGRFYDAFIEMSPAIYRAVMKTGRLKVGWNICFVVDAMDIRRCARCCSYDHLAKKCLSETSVCMKCGGQHDVKDCKRNTVKCINCVRANEKFGLKCNTHHCANDKSCPAFIRANQRWREKISL